MERIQTMERIPFSTKEGDFFSRIARRSRYSALSEDEQLAYDRWLKFENDRVLELEYSRREGLAEGLAEGRAEGKAEEKWEVARNAHNMGLDYNAISQLTGIAVSELEDRFGSL